MFAGDYFSGRGGQGPRYPRFGKAWNLPSFDELEARRNAPRTWLDRVPTGLVIAGTALIVIVTVPFALLRR